MTDDDRPKVEGTTPEDDPEPSFACRRSGAGSVFCYRTLAEASIRCRSGFGGDSVERRVLPSEDLTRGPKNPGRLQGRSNRRRADERRRRFSIGRDASRLLPGHSGDAA
jgi:hypothetical protein